MRIEEHPTDHLPAYVRGRVEDEGRVRAHLAACARCRAEVEVLRALFADPVPSMSEQEKVRVFDEFWGRRASRRSWWPGLLKAAAVLALLLAGGTIWRMERVSGDGKWSPNVALEGWEADLSDLRPEAGDVRVALGYDDESRDLSWAEGMLSPETLVVPWEDAR